MVGCVGGLGGEEFSKKKLKVKVEIYFEIISRKMIPPKPPME